jgi:hypothetical protein
MKQSHIRTVVAGVAGGIAINPAMLFTFRLIGFGWKGGGLVSLCTSLTLSSSFGGSLLWQMVSRFQ